MSNPLPLDALTNQPVVIDNGSGVIKAGFAGDNQPKCFFTSCVGRPKHVRCMAGAAEGDFFVGPQVQELRGLLSLNYPIDHGIVEQWDDMERIWQYIYSNELKILSEQHPVLLTEAPLNPRQHRQRAAQILFETFNVPALFISVQAVLSLYASGRTSGLVLDCGDGVSHCVPVYQGFVVPRAIQRIDLAGRDVTEYLQLLLRKSGYRFVTSAEKELVKTIKEKCCYVAQSLAKEEKEQYRKTEDYMLPDGKTIKLGHERFLAPEILFQPHIVGVESTGIHSMLLESIQRTDLDLRKHLLSNIVLSGGSTLFRGFGDKLLQEMRKENVDAKIKIYAPPERKYSTWIGGSIVASLGTFKKMWVSAEEYEEDPDIINKKSF